MTLPAGEKTTIETLLRGHWYDAVAALLAEQAGYDTAAELATAAKRVLDLDAEDFDDIAEGHESAWAARLLQARFPRTPQDPERGALGTLVPLYELMLEVLDLRATRHEPLQVVVTAHLIGEYLVQLAMESWLGHAGDPQMMDTSVGEKWGTDDRSCPHPSALRATAKRSMHACSGDIVAYTAYLDRFHSRLGEAFAICAMNHETTGPGDRPDVGETCPHPCSWITDGELEVRRDLDARVRLAKMYQDSAVVALRHYAPVGHFFGVPSTTEISDAWLTTWQRLSQQWRDGSNPLLAEPMPAAPEATEALPGMSALVSAVAGRTIGPGSMIRDIGADIRAALEAA